MQANIPGLSHRTDRQMPIPVEENSYMTNSPALKSRSQHIMSEPEKRRPEKKQFKYTGENTFQKINKQPEKKQKKKKIDIKKLIEQKQARQNVQKSVEQKEDTKISKVFKLFQSTDNPCIDRCLFCGYFVFNASQTQREAQKLEHAKKQHAQYPCVDKRSVETKPNTDQYIKMAQDLVKFAHHKDNRQLMQYVLGQYLPQPFKTYTEPMPVKAQLEKWAKVVEDVFKINS